MERLAQLRSLFWMGDSSLGRRALKLERQSDMPAFPAYRENVRWEMGGVLFAGLNLPGSENNFYGVDIASRDRKGPVAEYLERSTANRAWLGEAFAIARDRNLPGILIVAHGNPGFEAWSAGRAETGYLDFLTQLRDETQKFPGQVVLVHGDTHKQHIDQPMRGRGLGRGRREFHARGNLRISALRLDSSDCRHRRPGGFSFCAATLEPIGWHPIGKERMTPAMRAAHAVIPYR